MPIPQLFHCSSALVRPLSMRVAKPGHLRIVSCVDEGAATDDAAALVRTPLCAFCEGAVQGSGPVRKAP